MDLTKRFSHEQFVQALDSWAWVGIGGLGPRFTSLFGDVFLESRDGSWWHLDTFEGQLTQPWQNLGELKAALDTEEGQDRWLMGGLALGAYHRRGLRLEENQIYAYAPPPIVTGSFAVDEIQIFDFVVVVNLAGQLHEQLRGKPDGFEITEFTIDDSGVAGTP
jgi:hypothetical protein